MAQATRQQARWRRLLDDLIVKYAKSTSYGRAISERRGNLSHAVVGEAGHVGLHDAGVLAEDQLDLTRHDHFAIAAIGFLDPSG